eukprot:14920523-Alexandrium_andersonii.AAC.1
MCATICNPLIRNPAVRNPANHYRLAGIRPGTPRSAEGVEPAREAPGSRPPRPQSPPCWCRPCSGG